jgi:DNA-binding MarR family transcriptional regulator
MDDNEVDELSRAFDELGAAMRRGRAKSAADSSSGLSPAQFELLRALRDHATPDGLQVSVLANAAGLATPGVTRMLNELKRRQLIERRPSQTDGRATFVALTPEGREGVDTYQANLRAKQRLTFSTFDAAERVVLLRSLQRLTVLADEHSNYAAPPGAPGATLG